MYFALELISGIVSTVDLIQLAVPFFLLAMAFELGFGIARGRNTYRLNDAFSSLMLGILSQARKFIVLGVSGLVYAWAASETAIPQWQTDAIGTWVVAFILYDLCYYWLHRMGHERQILWAAHVAHHQSEDYNLSTALRQTSSGFLLGWIFYVPLFLLGIPAEVVVTVGAINLIYQFWVHTQHIPELGWMEQIFVTPSNHRVHHAQNDSYLDRNYGGVFIVWDRLFGTYQRELAEVPCVFGIRGPIRSWNPLVALTHIYKDMFDDMRRTTRWGDRFRVLWARTGWQPNDVRARWPREKTDLEQFVRFDPEVSLPRRVYGGLQLLAATVLLLWGQLGSLSPEGYWLWWLMLVWTGVVTAGWLQGWRFSSLCLLELPRFLTVVMTLVLLPLNQGWLIAACLWCGASLAVLAWEVGHTPKTQTA